MVIGSKLPRSVRARELFFPLRSYLPFSVAGFIKFLQRYSQDSYRWIINYYRFYEEIRVTTIAEGARPVIKHFISHDYMQMHASSYLCEDNAKYLWNYK